jgi:hypothetical protein
MTLAKCRITALLAGLLVLTSCSSKFTVTPCRLGDRIGFIIPENPGFFGSAPRKIWRIMVYQISAPPSLGLHQEGSSDGSDSSLWWTDDKREKNDVYSLVAYGTRLKGWTVGTTPKPLIADQEYHIDIVGIHGDDGQANFVPKDILMPCPNQ